MALLGCYIAQCPLEFSVGSYDRDFMLHYPQVGFSFYSSNCWFSLEAIGDSESGVLGLLKEGFSLYASHGLSWVMTVIVKFAFSYAHINLFLARFTFPDFVHRKPDLLSLTKTRFTLSSPSDICNIPYFLKRSIIETYKLFSLGSVRISQAALYPDDPHTWNYWVA